jgi:hypothetical protein
MRKIRGRRRNLNTKDLYANIYQPLLMELADYDGAPTTPFALVFVKKLDGPPLPNNTHTVYRHGDIYYERIANQDRDDLVKKYINQKRYIPKP